MRTTGSVYNVMGGSFYSSKGEYCICSVTAGVGGRSYMNYQKVLPKLKNFVLSCRKSKIRWEHFGNNTN